MASRSQFLRHQHAIALEIRTAKSKDLVVRTWHAMVTVSVPLSELRQARSLYRFMSFDERSELGMLRLRSDGTHRSWTGSDGREGMTIIGGPDSAVYDIGLTWAMISAAEAFVDGDDFAEVQIAAVARGGEPVIDVSGPLGRSTFWDRQLGYPTIDRPLIPEDQVAGEASVSVHRLLDALASVQWKRADAADENTNDPILMTFEDGEVLLEKHEDGVGRLDVRINAPGAWSDVKVSISAQAVHRVLDAAHPSDVVTIRLSKWNTDPVSFDSADWFAFVMPNRTENAIAVARVENVLREMFGPVALHKDDDGDYPLKLQGNQVYGRFTVDDDGTLWFQAFAIVVRDIEASPEVFSELNDLNANTRFVRLFHYGSQVLAEVDLLAATLDREELGAALERIARITDDVMPTLSAVLGGTLPDDAREHRWNNYRSTILEAEVIPGKLFHLNGPDAIDDFPFPDRCFAITAWNPMGTTRPPEKNREINQMVANDVINLNGMFLRGFGSSPEGDYSEETLFVWGLDRDSIRAMGRRAQQDAIFEIDAETVHLVSCFDDRIETWQRRSGMPHP